MRIRPLRLGDVPAAISLQQLTFPHDDWTAQSLHDELAAGPGHWWVVAESTLHAESALPPENTPLSESDAPPSGTASQSRLLGLAGSAAGGDVVDVLSLAVDPTARRRGVGRALLAELVGQARSVGAARVLLEVAADNDAALALYAGAGFTALSRRRGYYAGPAGPGSLDALVLELAL